MGKKIAFIKEYDSANVGGKAELSDSQIRGIENSGSIRLRKDLVYVVPRQYVHDEKLATPINGRDTSKKVFMVGIDPATNEAVHGITVSMNTLRQTHYGKLLDNPTLKIEATNDNDTKVWRAKGASVQSVFGDNPAPFKVSGKNAFVSRDFAFKVTDRCKVYTAQFDKPRTVAGQELYDMSTMEENGKKYLNLATPTVNEYTTVNEIPAVDWDECVPELAAMQEGLPA